MPKKLATWATAALAAVLLLGCSTVPLTGRQQLKLVSEPQLLQMSVQQYRKVLQDAELSDDRQKTAMVRRVGRRIAGATEEFLRQNGLGHEIQYYEWEFNLIEDDEMINAWAMPGGKIAVYTGLLDVTRDETGLAVVMGHEVAHAVADHGAERMSQGLLVQLGGVALSVAVRDQPAAARQLFLSAYGVGAAVGVMLPYSRRHEYEADRIGLTLMARGGYDPHAAVGLWQRMKEASKDKPKPPTFLSTHPAPQDRIERIRRYIPEAVKHLQSRRDERPTPARVRLASQ
jgi:predicted Zn-dependent protease